MIPNNNLEYWSHIQPDQRLQEAEQFRLVKLATEQGGSLTRPQKWKLGWDTLSIKLGLPVVWLILARFLRQ